MSDETDKRSRGRHTHRLGENGRSGVRRPYVEYITAGLGGSVVPNWSPSVLEHARSAAMNSSFQVGTRTPRRYGRARVADVSTICDMMYRCSTRASHNTCRTRDTDLVPSYSIESRLGANLDHTYHMQFWATGQGAGSNDGAWTVRCDHHRFKEKSRTK